MNFLDFDRFVIQNSFVVLFLLFYVRDELYIYSSWYEMDKRAAVMLI